MEITLLLSDAVSLKNMVKDILGGHLTRDGAKGVEGEAKVLGNEIG